MKTGFDAFRSGQGKTSLLTLILLLGIGIVAAILIVAVVIAVIVWLSKDVYDIADKLVGHLNALAGPYALVNGHSTEPGAAGYITSEKHPTTSIYAKYGFRVVDADTVLGQPPKKKSKIIRNTNIYTVFDITDPQDIGFTFRIPKQDASITGADFKYELLGTYWDNPTATGKPLYEDIPVALINSTDSPLEFVESEDPNINKILTDPDA